MRARSGRASRGKAGVRGNWDARVDIDAVQAAGDNERLRYTDVPGTKLGPAKVPVLSVMRSFA